MAKTVLEGYRDHLALLRQPRIDRGHESRYMSHANGWVMVRRPGCIPYTVTEKDWLSLPQALKENAL